MSKNATNLRRYIVPLLLLIVWEVVASGINNAATLPHLGEVGSVLIAPFKPLLGMPSWAYHLWVSLLRVGLGYLCAILIAIPTGIYLGRSSKLHELFFGTIHFFHPLSPIMWIPFAMILFKGYSIGDLFGLSRTASVLNELSLGMIFVILYGSFFPIFLNTINAVQQIPQRYLDTAALLHCSKSQMLCQTIFPAALPGITTGLQIGLGRAWMIIAAAEMLPGSEAGLGYLVQYAYSLAEMDILVAGMIIAGVTGGSLNFLLNKGLTRYSFWKSKEVVA